MVIGEPQPNASGRTHGAAYTGASLYASAVARTWWPGGLWAHCGVASVRVGEGIGSYYKRSISQETICAVFQAGRCSVARSLQERESKTLD